jgi:hypothetical protein
LNATRVWINDSGLSLDVALELPGEPILHVADLDGDGRSDLLTRSYDDVAVRRGLGGAAFGDPEPIAPFAVQRRNALAGRVADLDRDGDLDVLGYVDSELWIYANDGNAVFTPALRLLRGGGSRCLAIDADGDGHADVLAGPAPEALSGTLVFLSNGPGLSFEPPIMQVFNAATAVDADGDGDLDILSEDVDHSSSVHPLPDHLIRCVTYDGSGAGSRAQYGPSLAGTGGVAPILGAVGPFRVGLPHEIRLVGGRGGARAYLAYARNAGWTERRGGVLLVGAPFSTQEVTLTGVPGAVGAGRVSFRRAVTPPPFAGRRFFLQVAVVDPEAQRGVAFSNGLEIRFGD